MEERIVYISCYPVLSLRNMSTTGMPEPCNAPGPTLPCGGTPVHCEYIDTIWDRQYNNQCHLLPTGGAVAPTSQQSCFCDHMYLPHLSIYAARHHCWPACSDPSWWSFWSWKCLLWNSSISRMCPDSTCFWTSVLSFPLVKQCLGLHWLSSQSAGGAALLLLWDIHPHFLWKCSIKGVYSGFWSLANLKLASQLFGFGNTEFHSCFEDDIMLMIFHWFWY